MTIFKSKQGLDIPRNSTDDKLLEFLNSIEIKIRKDLTELRNIGSGEGLYKDKQGNISQIKSILNGNNVDFEVRDDMIIINCPTVSGQGTVDTASNLTPSGIEGFHVFNFKQNTDLKFRSLVPRTNMVIEETNEALYLDVTGDPITQAASDIFAYNNFF